MHTALLALLNAGMSVVYLLLARVVSQRRPAGDGRLAATSFAIWWVGLGVLSAAAVADPIVRALGGWSLAGYLAYLHLLLLVLMAALAGLMYYMVYLFTGLRGAWLPIAAAYAAYYCAIVYWLALMEPYAVQSQGLSTRAVFANELSRHWSGTVIGLLLVTPPLVAALGYLSLFFRVPERSQRFRIAAIAGAFVLWFGTSLAVQQLTDWGRSDAWRVASTLIALSASLLVFFAFRPPTWLQRRFGLAGYGQPPGTAARK